MKICRDALEPLDRGDRKDFLCSINLIASLYDEDDKTERARHRHIEKRFRRRVLLCGERAPLRWYERILYSDSIRPTPEWRKTVDKVVKALKALSKEECTYLDWRLDPTFGGQPLSKADLRILGGYASQSPAERGVLEREDSSDDLQRERHPVVAALVEFEKQRTLTSNSY